EPTGGIQRAAGEAWSGIIETMGHQRARALQYKEGASKARAIADTLGIRHKPKTILVWHIGLLKLLPFLRYSASRVAVVLHGIEAWTRQDIVTRHLLGKVHR